MNEQEREMLLTLFLESRSLRGGVPKAAFRVKHRSQRGVIDQLVVDGHARLQSEKYLANPLSLRSIDDEEVKQFFKDCEMVLAGLRERYIENQEQMIPLPELASRSTLSVDRFCFALAYLQDWIPLLAGRSLHQIDDPAYALCPSDLVLDLESLDKVFEMLQHFRDASRRVDAQLAAVNGFPLETEESRAQGAPRRVGSSAAVLTSRVKHLPAKLRGLFQEVILANETGLMRLVAMGVRATVDAWCDEVVGHDLSSFVAKLRELRTRGYISASQHAHLSAVVQLGHASAHRGYEPSRKDVEACLDILERALKSHYHDTKTTTRISAKTPARKRRSSVSVQSP